jgi:hypothetical protein
MIDMTNGTTAPLAIASAASALPPGVSFSLLGRDSLDESASELRTRNQTLLETAEHAIPVSGDDVVNAVQERGWQDAHQDGRLPRPPQLAGDEQRGAAPAEHLNVIRSIVCQNVKRGQFVRVGAETLDRGPSHRALERSEGEHRAPIVLEEELQQTAAQSTDPVVEHEVSAFGRRWHLRC